MNKTGLVLVLFASLIQVTSAQIPPVRDLGYFGFGGKTDVSKLELQEVNRFGTPILLGSITRTNVVGLPDHPVVRRTATSFVSLVPGQSQGVAILVANPHGTLDEIPAGIAGFTVTFKSGRSVPFFRTSSQWFDQVSADLVKGVDEFNAKATSQIISDTTKQLALIDSLHTALTTLPPQLNAQVKIAEALYQARNRSGDEANAVANNISNQFASGVTQRANLLKKDKLKCNERDAVLAYTEAAFKTIDAALLPKASELLRYAEATHLSLDLITANVKALSEAMVMTRKLPSSQTPKLYSVFSTVNESKLSQIYSRANEELTKTKILEEIAKPGSPYIRRVKSPIQDLVNASKRDCLK